MDFSDKLVIKILFGTRLKKFHIYLLNQKLLRRIVKTPNHIGEQ